MDLDPYAREKIGLAADALKGRGSKREKLQKVATRTLSAVFAKDFPDHLRSQWEEIHSALTQRGKVSETVDAMTEAEASEIARKIIALDALIGD